MKDAIRSHKDKATELLAKGKVDAALVEYRAILKLQPKDVASRQKVAELLAKQGKTHDAILQYQQVAGCYAVDGLLLKSIAICKVILSLDANHTETQTALAGLYGKQRQTTSGVRATATLPASMTASMRPATVAPVLAAPVGAPAAPPPPPEELEQEDSRLLVGGAPPPPLPPVDESEELETLPDTEVEIQMEESTEMNVDTSTMPHIPLFSDLSGEDFMAVMESANLRTFFPGEVIVQEGDMGTSMYAVVQGAVDVARANPDGTTRVVANMGEGAFFGEMAMFTDAPRLASILAKEDTVLLEFTRERMQEIIAAHPGVGVVLEEFYQERLLANVMRSNPIFMHFSAAEKAVLTKAFKSRAVETGEILLQQGARGDGFYLLLRGKCEVVHKEANGTEHFYPDMREGDVFGEISLLLNQPVSATVRAEGTCLVLRLPKQTFEELFLANPEVRQMVSRLSSDRLKRTQELMARLQSQSGFMV